MNKKYIKRCIEIGKNGLGTTRPNPMVGCVIVHKNKIIGEGFTSAYGSNHAEVNAIASVQDKSKLKEATLYVTLEPCSHYGKTPPCSNLIIEHSIANIVIGTIDTHHKVAGQGIDKLRGAGCNVVVGVLEDECKQHHKRFFTFHNKIRPYIILKWAQTTDGFIAPQSKKEKTPIWITNEYSKQLVHKWRAEEQAILVGTNTVMEDNPSLTTRSWKGNNPIRIVIDKENILSKALNILDESAETIIISKNTINFEAPIARQICDVLYMKNINSVIIEGGQQTIQTFINENLWDEARVFTGNKIFCKGVIAPKLNGNLVSENTILKDTLKIYTND